MIAPVTLFHHLQHAEEFRHNPIVGVYIRWVRILGVFISVFLVPLWLILVEYRDLLPEILAFIGPKESPPYRFLYSLFWPTWDWTCFAWPASIRRLPGYGPGTGRSVVDRRYCRYCRCFCPGGLLYISLVAIGSSTPLGTQHGQPFGQFSC